MPAIPAAASTHPAIARILSGAGVRATATRRNTARPNSAMSPAYMSQRAATALSEGWGALLTAGFVDAPPGETPTPKANDPLAMCPSTWESVCQVTV
jgi:hypothetical protein